MKAEIEIIMRPNCFNSQLKDRMNLFRMRYDNLVTSALDKIILSNKHTHDNIIKRISPSKAQDIFKQVENIYKLLACIKSIFPDYNELWLLFGIGDMFDKNNNNQNNNFNERFETLLDYIINNINFHTRIYNKNGKITIDDLIESINILLIDNDKDRELIARDRFDPHFDHLKNEDKIMDIEEYAIDGKDIYDFIKMFQDLFASMNKLKSIIKNFNEAWLLFDEGDMFENTDKLTEK